MDGVGDEPRRRAITTLLIVRRARTGRLADATVSPLTRRRYNSALREFFSYLAAMSLPVPADLEELDLCATEFIQLLYEEGCPQQRGREFAAGMQDAIPQTRRHLPTMWRWLGA